MLNLTIGAIATFSAFFGSGTGSIALNNVQCVGTEATLGDCLSGMITSCSHSEDAGVMCLLPTGTRIVPPYNIAQTTSKVEYCSSHL